MTAHLDRDKARAVLEMVAGNPDGVFESDLRDLEACVVQDPPTTIDRDVVNRVVGRVLFNNANYPERVRPYILGQDTAMLRTLIVNAIMDEVQPAAGITLSTEEVAAVTKPSDPTQRMTAYYYGFDRTGFAAIDDVLSAVATAGKHYHSTAEWTDDEDGPSEQAVIQAAADRGAEALRALAARLEASA